MAKVPKPLRTGLFPKADFILNLERSSCTFPAGHTTCDLRTRGTYRYWQELSYPRLYFQYSAAAPVSLHSQEALLQAAWTFQQSPAFRRCTQLRQAAEHRIGLLVQLGLRQVRYMGRAKILFQLEIAPAAANFTLVAHRSRPPSLFSSE